MAAAVSAAGLSLAAAYFVSRLWQNWKFQIEEMRYQIRMIRDSNEGFLEENLPRSISRNSEERSANSIRSELADLTARVQSLNFENERLLKQLFSIKDSERPVSEEFDTPSDEATLRRVEQTLARDINHALKTPLSRLDTTSALLESSILDKDEAAQRIKNATQLCYYYLDSFRSFSLDLSPHSDSDNLDFRDSIKNAASLYISDSKKDLGIQVRVPEALTVIADYYAIATLMPLIENAVEASPDLSDIEIEAEQIDNELRVSIRNTYVDPPPADFETRGITNKPNSTNEGLGIAIARSLLQPLSTGELEFEVDTVNRVFTALVRMKAK